MSALSRIDRGIIKAEEIAGELLLGAIIILVFVAAVFRQFAKPLVWDVDMAQLLFVWACFIGADLAMEKNKHIGVDLLTNLMPKKVTKSLNLFSDVLIIVFLCLIAIFGARLAIINVKDQFAGMEISHSWATWSAPVGCVLMIRTMAKKIAALARGEAGTVKEAS